MAPSRTRQSEERAGCRVPNTELQHRTMIEAVENHMPEVVVIDEIGTELEAIASRTIGRTRGPTRRHRARQHFGKRHQQPHAV